MQTSCPRCATTVNETEGLCRQCGSSVAYLVRRRARTDEKVSYTERYRGTIYDAGHAVEMVPQDGIARGRAFVVVSLAALATLFCLVLVSGPPA